MAAEILGENIVWPSHQLQVSITTLRRVTTMLFDRIEAQEGELVDLDEDLFWSIPADTVYAMAQQPSRFSVESLSETVEFLESMEREPDLAVSFGLVWVADVARAIGLSRVV